jgi:hypothetical protein
MAKETIEIIVDESVQPGNPVIAAVALNGTVVAQQPSMLSNLVYANHVVSNDLGAKSLVGHQDAMNRLRQSIVAKAVSQVQDLAPATARAAVDALSSNALAQEIADLKAAIEAFSPPA